ncbi:MAG: CvpA family protein [Bacteroidales bacterium]|jgi:membrane protein required for colicin V production|nr:CvpA family protein [Bacteroidales bacterium]
MNWLDIVLAIPMLWFLYRGFRNGLIIELASLAALILGIYVALHFSFYVEGWLVENFEIGEKYLYIISFALTFIIVAVLVFLAGKIIHKLVGIIFLGFLNRLAGGIFGLLKAALVLSVILYFVNGFNPGLIKADVKDSSVLYDPVESIVPFIIPRLDLDQVGLPNTEKPEHRV